MKKLINGVDNIVDEMLDGMICAYPQYLKRLDGFDVVVHYLYFNIITVDDKVIV